LMVRNLRTVWTINPQPYRDAHFATYPERLVEPCIKAGTSEKGVCPRCLSPWVRVVEAPHVGCTRDKRPDHPHASGTLARPPQGARYQGKTKGWAPSCKCHEPMPEGLVEPCIKAGTSEKGVCPRCGTPWGRDLEVSGGTIGKGWHDHEGDDEKGQRKDAGVGDYQRKTRGWTPRCSCVDLEPIPATVFDPFTGSGTTGMVANRLGRSFVGTELNPEYAEMARRRIGGTMPLFSSEV